MSNQNFPIAMRLVITLLLLTWVAVGSGVSSSLRAPFSLTGEYIVLDMNDATKAGTLSVTVTTQAPKPSPGTGTITSKTTVQINVEKGESAESKMQRLADSLDQAAPDGAIEGSPLRYVDATYVATPAHLVIAAAPQPEGAPIQTLTNVSVKDKSGQKIKERRGHLLAEGGSIGGQVVLFREPSGVNADGFPSTVWIGTDRGQINYPVSAFEDLEGLTAGLLAEMSTAGFSVRSDAPGVLVFRLNEVHDGLSLSVGSDDAALVYSFKLTE